tara:strand:+ start:3479 stop:3628 length:150 start_codon:yes stop_codon:yes gene_type:complete
MKFNQKEIQFLNGLINDYLINYDEEYEKELGYSLNFVKNLQHKFTEKFP